MACISQKQSELLQNAALHGTIRKRTTYRDYHRTFDQLRFRGMLEEYEIDKYRLTDKGRAAVAKIEHDAEAEYRHREMEQLAHDGQL